MQKINIQDLLEKYRTNTLSHEERRLLEIWYVQWQPEDTQISQEELESTKIEVLKAIKQTPVKFRKIQRWQIISAAASIFLILSVTTWYLLQKPFDQSKLIQHTAQINVIGPKPGGNKAILTLSNGKKIVLTDAKSGKLAEQGKVAVNKTGDGKIIYQNKVRGSGDVQSEMVYNTMSTPRGGQYNLTLSDGTKIWLNAASSITYPVVFSSKERKVTIIGEVYFEVAHNKNSPFIVSTGNQEIKVLGTHFNVKGYEDDAGISTTLLSGSVMIRNIVSNQSHLLNPGQQARIFKYKPEINITNVNVNDIISWKNGYFIFDNQQISSIMKIIGRWYDVDVEYRTLNKSERFGGTFSRSATLSEILANLEKLGKIHFKVQSRKIIVTD